MLVSFTTALAVLFHLQFISKQRLQYVSMILKGVLR